MIERIVAFGTRRPWVVIGFAVLLALCGELARRALPRDAIPDLSNPQIVLVVDWMGHPADEVATSVTNVLTGSFEGLPGMTAVRGSSMAGMAYIDVIFDAPSDLERGRDAIVQRCAQVRDRLPPTARLEVGPLASSTGWVFEYALVDPHRKQSAVALRGFQDDVLRPALAAISGVVEVATVGGGVEQVVVELEADRLRTRGAAVSDVVIAVEDRLAAHPAASPSELADVAARGRGRATGGCGDAAGSRTSATST